MPHGLIHRASVAAFLMSCALPAFAQQIIPGATGGVATREGLPLEPTAFGPNIQVLWISAPEFVGKTLVGQPDLVLAAGIRQYYTSPGSSSPQVYYAPLRLPAGALVSGVKCFIRDQSATNNLLIALSKHNHNTFNDTVGMVWAYQIDPIVSSMTGYAQPAFSIPQADALITYVDAFNNYTYVLQANVASDTELRGCQVFWSRSVAPSPGTATFADVPDGHPQRQFIEALVAAGITGGCGGGNYCPDAPLTRGQMAVFLAAALGLHWPN